MFATLFVVLLDIFCRKKIASRDGCVLQIKVLGRVLGKARLLGGLMGTVPFLCFS